MVGLFTTMATWVLLQVKFETNLPLFKWFLLSDFITSYWRRQALVLGCVPFSDRHSSINIAEWMVKELDEWQLTPVTEMVVSDTASN